MIRKVLAATFDFEDSSISFCELERIGDCVVDNGELIPISEFDTDASDCAVCSLAWGEIPGDELKAELEETLRLRMAHHNLCHPNIPLQEK
jgi:hypothetical protein